MEKDEVHCNSKTNTLDCFFLAILFFLLFITLLLLNIYALLPLVLLTFFIGFILGCIFKNRKGNYKVYERWTININGEKRPLDDAKYFEEMFGNLEDQDIKTIQRKIEKALEKAHDIRKFEIELLWKRATYYWVMIAFIFGVYSFTFKFLTDDLQKNQNIISNIDFFLPVSLTIVAYIGFMISTFWIEVAKSSKRWYENWEKHIDKLEYYVTGNLHKVVSHNPRAPVVASISKLTIASAYIVTMGWLILLIYSAIILHETSDIYIIFLMFLSLVGIILWYIVRKYCISKRA